MERIETKTMKSGSSKLGKTLLAAGTGALTGFIATYFLLGMTDDGGALSGLGTSREIALLVALVYGLTAAAVLFGLASPKVGAKFLNVEDAEELREQRAMLGWSGAGMLCWTGVLVVLALGGEGFPIPPVAAIVIAGLLVAVSVVTTMIQWRHTDELMRDLSRESAAMAFYLLMLLGGGWAALGHLGLATGPAFLDWWTMAAAVILVAVYWKSARRGMLEMR